MRLRITLIRAALFALCSLSCSGQEMLEPSAGTKQDGGSGLTDVYGGRNLPPPGCEGVACIPCSSLSDCVAILPASDPCATWSCNEGWCASVDRAVGASCDDGEICTLDARCEALESGLLQCLPAGPPCDDGSACTRDLCDPETGCVYTVEDIDGCCEQHSDCDDHNECTVDVCGAVNASCSHQPLEALCDDHDPCTFDDSCVEGACSGTPSDGCGIFCRLEGAKGAVAECPLNLARLTEAEAPPATLSFRVEYDGISTQLHTILDPSCTGGLCILHSIPQGGVLLGDSGHEVSLNPAEVEAWAGKLTVAVAHPVAPDAALSPAYFDGEVLRGGDPQLFIFRFTLGKEIIDAPVLLKEIESGGPGGAPLLTKLIGDTIVTSDVPCGDEICFDHNSCTEDKCLEGICVYEPSSGPCDDGNPCMVGSQCDGKGGCGGGQVVGPNTACVGQNLCTDIGACDDSGACHSDPLLSVDCPDDGSACLHTNCNPQTGTCYKVPLLDALCDDGDICTVQDGCDSVGSCAGEEISCNDGVGCTADVCDPNLGCGHKPVHFLCQDGNPCTHDICNANKGCSHESIDGLCEDDNVCTHSDHCLNGLCVGTADPACGCTMDSDCWFLSQTSLCSGSYFCDAGVCTLDIGSVVVCPPDGYGCKESWQCKPETGQCSGEIMTCDDGQACTQDSCSLTKGCLHLWIPGCAAGWDLCTLVGDEGDVVDCALRVARANEMAPILSGMDIKIGWDKGSVELIDLLDEQCIGNDCFPFSLLACAGASGICVSNKLHPTGHEILVVPGNKQDWEDRLSLLAYHGTAPATGLQSAVLTSEEGEPAKLIGEANMLTFRFRLLKKAPAESAVGVEVMMLEVNPLSGRPLQIKVAQDSSGTLFVVGGAQ